MKPTFRILVVGDMSPRQQQVLERLREHFELELVTPADLEVKSNREVGSVWVDETKEPAYERLAKHVDALRDVVVTGRTVGYQYTFTRSIGKSAALAKAVASLSDAAAVDVAAPQMDRWRERTQLYAGNARNASRQHEQRARQLLARRR